MHLVLQAPGIRHDLIEQAAALVSANRITPLNACAMRLEEIDQSALAELQAWARSKHVDVAALEDIRPLHDMKVLAMDMDSTLINIECIDEIADMVGKKAEVSAITEAAMRGEITDFSESLRRRVALLKGVAETDLLRVYNERLQLNVGAEKLIRTMRPRASMLWWCPAALPFSLKNCAHAWDWTARMRMFWKSITVN